MLNLSTEFSNSAALGRIVRIGTCKKRIVQGGELSDEKQQNIYPPHGVKCARDKHVIYSGIMQPKIIRSKLI